ncbi:metallophosphoesterase family protein [Oharaeibacter diazotrophicus]|uniref:metallophosphoesterase family protein n=1 Tax=Oharaeibacter diazotrophicus TaxID=1920512 RepID=UPI000F84818D|nr:metallophosphoesterase family protein [Oharaeibacter diazotrophicus]
MPTGGPEGRVEDGTRIYCIGDVHGRADLLGRVRGFVVDDLATAPERRLTVFLGDLVDRGPDSAGVLEAIATGWPTGTVVLRGNHETEFLAVLDQPRRLAAWQRHGGLETLASYGVPVVDVVRGGRFSEAVAALKDKLPPAHLELVAGARASFVSGDFFFCHAGVRPGVALDAQTEEDLTTIRSPFLDFDGDFGKIVVHGHTPVRAPVLKANRIALDTGAYMTDVLTCAVFEAGAIRLFSTAD